VHSYYVTTTGGTLDIRAGAGPGPAAAVTADSTTWSRILFGDMTLTHAERDGTARIAGDRDAVVRVVGLYVPSSQARGA
jgi:hypothetical protein